ncbi:hypothetical protein STENM223S_01706 [Streptomyces tendae]
MISLSQRRSQRGQSVHEGLRCSSRSTVAKDHTAWAKGMESRSYPVFEPFPEGVPEPFSAAMAGATEGTM